MASDHTTPDAVYPAAVVVEMIAAAAERAGGVRALAREWDVSAAYLSNVLCGSRSPGPKVCAPLGITVQAVRTTRYTYLGRAG